MAESEILRGGRWEPRSFQAEGAVHVEIMGTADSRLQLEVDGLQAQLRRQSATGGAFAVQGARDGVTIFAAAEAAEAFPGGAMVDLSLSFPSARRDYLVERIDISGHQRAPLVRITADGEKLQLSPAEALSAPRPATSRTAEPASQAPSPPIGAAPSSGGETIAEMLGAWIGRRRGDRGAAVLPTVREVRIDRSASMIPFADRADTLRDLVLSLARAAGGPLPDVVDSSIGGARRSGVGSAAVDRVDSSSGSARTLLITDIPVQGEWIANLVIGDPQILDALATEDAHGLAPDAWSELEREDTRFDDATLRRLEPLLDWLTREPRAEEANR